MIVLGIETATTVCGVAMSRDGRVIAEESVDKPRAHAERILGLIDTVLKGSVSLDSVDAIAVSIGPGSFTGLRIGVSVAKGLAYAAGKSLVAVPTLTALAEKARRGGAVVPGERILAILKARRNEAFAQWFTAETATVCALEDVRVAGTPALVREASTARGVLTGDCAMVTSMAGEELSLRVLQPPVSQCDAGTVALLGADLFARGRTADTATLEPEYKLDFFLNTLTT